MRELKSSTLAQATCFLEKLKVRDLPVPRATEIYLLIFAVNSLLEVQQTNIPIFFPYNDINYNQSINISVGRQLQ